MKIMHVISGLNNGGAESVLFRLVTAPSGSFEHTVVVMQQGGYYWDRLVSSNIEVVSLNMPNGRLSFSGLYRLYKLLRSKQPDIVQTWMYHADLVGGLVARLARARVVNWGVRLTNPRQALTSRSTQVIVRLCAGLSKYVPTSIISCAYSAVDSHVAMGYERAKFHVIPNGFDTDKLKFCPQSRTDWRDAWKVTESTMVFGHLARWSPQKDHATLFASVRAFASTATKADWRLVVAGPEIDANNSELTEMVAKYGLSDSVILCGSQSDVTGYMSAIDCFVLSSRDEGFPNVLAESMACQVPCITTDVGDARHIVENTGWITPAGDSGAFSAAMCQAWSEKSDNHASWASRKIYCRERVAGQFNIASMVRNFESKWKAHQKV